MRNFRTAATLAAIMVAGPAIGLRPSEAIADCILCNSPEASAERAAMIAEERLDTYCGQQLAAMIKSGRQTRAANGCISKYLTHAGNLRQEYR